MLVLLLHLSGPGLLRALCAVVQTLGQGHRDCHPFMPQHGTEASLSPAAGTSCAAACIASSHHLTSRKCHKAGDAPGQVATLDKMARGVAWCRAVEASVPGSDLSSDRRKYSITSFDTALSLPLSGWLGASVSSPFVSDGEQGTSYTPCFFFFCKYFVLLLLKKKTSKYCNTTITTESAWSQTNNGNSRPTSSGFKTNSPV